jgi:hypothetical protein
LTGAPFAAQKYEERTVIFPTVLYRCKTLSCIMREELRLRVFDNRVLRKILRPERDPVNGDWRRLHTGELHDLYS